MFVGEKTAPAALFGLHSLLVLFTAGKLPECTDQRGVVQRSREEEKRDFTGNTQNRDDKK